MVGYCTVNHCQAHAGALTGGFGGEKRFKNLAAGFIIHAAAVISHGEKDIFFHLSIGMFRRRSERSIQAT